ncbi:MAG: hypothetical protein ACYTBW_01305 [Planctomycetota bacterium]|jgi:hypothetical protein
MELNKTLTSMFKKVVWLDVKRSGDQLKTAYIATTNLSKKEEDSYQMFVAEALRGYLEVTDPDVTNDLLMRMNAVLNTSLMFFREELGEASCVDHFVKGGQV